MVDDLAAQLVQARDRFDPQGVAERLLRHQPHFVHGRPEALRTALEHFRP